MNKCWCGDILKPKGMSIGTDGKIVSMNTCPTHGDQWNWAEVFMLKQRIEKLEHLVSTIISSEEK